MVDAYQCVADGGNNQNCVQSRARLSMCLLLYLLQVVKTVQGALRISRQEVAPSKWSKKWLGKQRMLLQLKKGNNLPVLCVLYEDVPLSVTHPFAFVLLLGLDEFPYWHFDEVGDNLVCL